eukprot:4692070-Amphidinium_carterae.1
MVKAELLSQTCLVTDKQMPLSIGAPMMFVSSSCFCGTDGGVTGCSEVGSHKRVVARSFLLFGFLE